MGGITARTVNLLDLPLKFREDAWQCIKPYALGLVSDDDRVASGTLVRWGDDFGILTAYHVARAFETQPSAKLHLSLTGSIIGRRHDLSIPVQYLKIVHVGIPRDCQIGPDISVFILPPASPALAELKARKTFWGISHNGASKKQAALEDDGIWWVAGCPKKHVRLESAQNAINVGLIGFGAGKAEKYAEGDFDYLRIAIPTDWPDYRYDSFEGLSGSGVWRTPIYKTEQTDEFFFKDCFLAGVAFCESAEDNGCRKILCHGAESIYHNTLRVLQRGK